MYYHIIATHILTDRLSVPRLSFYERRASFSFLTQTVRSHRKEESQRMARIEIFVGIHLVSMWALCLFDKQYGQAGMYSLDVRLFKIIKLN